MEENENIINEEKPVKKKKIWMRVVLIIVCIVLLLILGIMIVANHYLGMIRRVKPSDVSVIPPEAWESMIDDDTDFSDETDDFDDTEIFDTEDPDDTAEDTEPDDTETTAKPLEPKDDGCLVEPIKDEGLINILLVGQDGYNYKPNVRSRTDSMILISINPKTGKISMISFLRDTFVTIPGGYTSNRLNVPFVIGGFPLLYETFYVNFGIHIDYGFGVNFQGFEKIIDILGGIDIELTEAETHHVSKTVPGMNTLNGAQALSYARIRHVDSDFGRTNRQRKVLMTVYNKIKGSSLSKLNELLKEILPLMFTDMSDMDIYSLVFNLYKFFGNDIDTYYIPAKKTYSQARVGKKSVIMPNLEKINTILREEYLPLN
ncbi:MAG: LCP family protein [Firmicutes bacterium]|nr:LCP family protein [Candidatus Colimorpha enterica]